MYVCTHNQKFRFSLQIQFFLLDINSDDSMVQLSPDFLNLPRQEHTCGIYQGSTVVIAAGNTGNGTHGTESYEEGVGWRFVLFLCKSFLIFLFDIPYRFLTTFQFGSHGTG